MPVKKVKKGKGSSTSSSSTSPSSSPPRSSSGLTLADSDFTFSGSPKLQTCTLIFGDAGEGKTTFATRFAPDPVAFINYDGRADYAILKAREEFQRKIGFTQIHYPSDLSSMSSQEAQIMGQQALDKTMRNLEIAVRESEKGNIRSICLDTATELTDVMSLAITGNTEMVKGDYGRSKGLINKQWWTIFDLAREGTAHLIVLARAKEVWVNSSPTGRYTFRGPDVIHDGVDWAGWIRLKRKKKTGAPLQEFEIEVTKSGVNIGELGAVYGEDDWEELGGPFAYACMLQYEGTDVEDWR